MDELLSMSSRAARLLRRANGPLRVDVAWRALELAAGDSDRL